MSVNQFTTPHVWEKNDERKPLSQYISENKEALRASTTGMANSSKETLFLSGKSKCFTNGHTYGSDGKCTQCGATDPNYKVEVPEEKVEEKMDPVAVLESKYNTASAQLEQNRSSAQQRAAVSLAKLQKYLPQQLKAQGLSGLGVSQTAALRMMNNYNAQMGEIDRDFNAGASDLLANYSDGRVALENAAAQDALAREQLNLQKYQIEEQNKTDKDAKAYSLYSDIVNMIDMGDFKTSGELTAYIDAHREDLGDYADRLDVIAKSRGEYIDEVEEENNKIKEENTAHETSSKLHSNTDELWFFGQDDFSDGDNFEVESEDGKKYFVESGGEVTDQIIKDAAISVKDDSVFKYGQNLYLKKSGKIYKIQRRYASYGTDSNEGYDALYRYISNE